MTGNLTGPEFPQSRFDPHGRVEILGGVEQIFTSVIEGPLNLEAVRASHQTRLEYLRLHAPTVPWCILALCRTNVLTSPEGLQAHRDGLHCTFVNNFIPPRAVAFVPDGDVEGFNLMTPLYLANYRAIGVEARVFSNVAEARMWLVSMLSSEASGSGADRQ